MQHLCFAFLRPIPSVAGLVALCVTAPLFAQPSNDDPCGAISVGSTDLQITNVDATASGVPQDCNPGLKDIWFRTSIPNAISINVLNSSFPPVISVYKRQFNACANLAFDPIACTTPQAGSTSAHLHVNFPSSFTIGDEYFIRIATADPNFLGTATLRVSSTTTFATMSYQGELRDGGAPFAGNLDVAFVVFDSATGGSVLQSLVAQSVPTDFGRFTCLLKLDPRFFDGRDVYLEPRVRPTGSGQAFTTLLPRQRVFAAPHALIAHEAETIPRALAGDGSASTASRSDHTHTSLSSALGGSIALQASSTGDIGIGTTVPAVRLHVREGSSGVTPSTSASAAFERSTTNYVQILSPDANERGLVFGSPSSGFTAGLYYTNASGMSFRTGGNATRMVIDAAGLVGIGISPTSNRLEVSGNASKSTAGSWLANSDARIKQDIRPIENAMATLDRVNLVSFEYTPTYRAMHGGIDDRRYLNVIAQEFAQVFPDWVKPSGEKLPDGSGILQVDTYPLTIYSAAAVKELHAKVQSLEATVKLQDAQIAEQNARLRALESAIKSVSK